MRIAINAQLGPRVPGGVETNLVSMLLGMAKAPPAGVDVALLTLDRYTDEFRAMFPFAQALSWPYGQMPRVGVDPAPVRGQAIRRMMGDRAHLFDAAVAAYRRARYGPSAADQTGRIDAALTAASVQAVHFPTSQLFDTRLPFIYEPWDLQHIHYPEFFSEAEYLMRERTYRHGCRKARLLITASEWTRRDIVDKYGVDPRRIVTIRRSSLIARKPMTKAEIDAEASANGFPEAFIFYPAMCFEHKNHLRLFKALTILRERGLVVPLVLSGRSHKPYAATFNQALDAMDLRGQVKVLGPVSDAVLTALYSRARFMVFPSLFEGLGLPVLEAFHHGLPVLAADETCLPEVTGDAAVLFNARSETAIADAIETAWSKPRSLSGLKAKGRARLKEFSWEKGVPLLSACYKHVVGAAMTPAEAEAFAQARETRT